jgi:hypothetical protein
VRGKAVSCFTIHMQIFEASSESGCWEQALLVELWREGARLAAAESALPLQRAAKRPLDKAAVAAALGQLGNNPLAVAALDLSQLDLEAGTRKAFLAFCSSWGESSLTELPRWWALRWPDSRLAHMRCTSVMRFRHSA